MANTRRSILTTTMGLLQGLRAIINPARRILLRIRRLDLLLNTPQGSTVEAIEAGHFGATSFPHAVLFEAVSRVPSGILREIMVGVSPGLPKVLTRLMPQHISPQPRAATRTLIRRRATLRWRTVTIPSDPPKTFRLKIPAEWNSPKKTLCRPPAGRLRPDLNPRHPISLVLV